MRHWISAFKRSSPALLLVLTFGACLAENRALFLPGNGKMALIPNAGLQDDAKEGTIEFWCRPEGIPQPTYLLSLGDSFLQISTNLMNPNDSIRFRWKLMDGEFQILDVPIAFDSKWFHIAATWDQQEVEIYINGEAFFKNTLKAPLKVPEHPVSLFLGSDSQSKGQTFRGYLDEIRIWPTVRSGDQIKNAMLKPSLDSEDNLTSSFDFDGAPPEALSIENDVEIVSFPGTFDWKWGNWSRLKGTVSDIEGSPVKRCHILLEEHGNSRLIGKSDSNGDFVCFIDHLEEGARLRLQDGRRRSTIVLNPLEPGSSQQFDIVLRDHISISGFVRGLDEKTPIQGVFVDAIDMSSSFAGKTRAVGLTDKIGSYELTDLVPGEYLIRIRTGTLAEASTRENAFGISSAKLQQLVSIKDITSHQRIDLQCPPGPTWNRTVFSTLDGLPGIPVLSVDEGASGNIWVGSLTWYCSYTGKSFNVVEHDLKPGTNITHSKASSSTGDACMYVIDTSERRLIFINEESPIGAIHLPTSLDIRQLKFDESNRILFSNADGVYRLENWREHLDQQIDLNHWEHFAVSNARIFTTQPGGHIWTPGRTGLVHIKPDGTQEVFTHEALNQVLIREIEWHSTEETLWLATSNGLGLLKDGQLNWVLNDHREWSNLKTIMIDSNGNGWIGTEFNGLFKLRDGEIFHFVEDTDASQGRVIELAEGAGNSIWVASTNGLYLYQESPLQSFSAAHGLPKATAFTISPQVDAKRVWVGMEWRGPAFFDGYQFKLSPEHNSISNAFFRDSGYTPSGRMWMSLQEGLAFFEKDTLDWIQITGLNGSAWAVTAQPIGEGHFLVGRGWAAGGVIQVNAEGQLIKSYTKEHGLPDDQVWEVYQHTDDTFLIGTIKGVRQLKDGNIESIDAFQRLTEIPAYSFTATNDDALWAATGEGIFKVQNEVETKLSIPSIPEDFMTWKVMVDDRNILWIGTDAYGVIAYDGQRFSEFNTHTGLPSNTVLDIKQGPDGAIWMATANGVARYLHTPYEPRLRIEDLQIEDQSYPNISHPILATVGDDIQFHLTWNHLYQAEDNLMVVGHVRNETTRETYPFQTKMSDDHSINWSPTQPGDYVMECRLSDPDLNQSAISTARFKATLPWHQDTRKTIPLLLSATILVGGLTMGAARGYMHRRQARKYQAQLLTQERKSREDLETKNAELKSAQKEALAAMHSAEKANQAKSIFVANMSHEIRSPLNAVLGYAQILRHDHAANPSTLKALGVIEKSGQHLLRLINDMLELSKIESGTMDVSPTRFDLITMLESVSDIVQISCVEKNIEWSIRWFDNLPFPKNNQNRNYINRPQRKIWVHADEPKLKQILLNLLSNAAKYSEGGEIHLEIGLPSKWQDRTQKEVNATVFFEINDTGQGISNEDQATILKPFVQGSSREKFQGGVGLGLSIAKRLVELFHGQLEFKSIQGVGSQFYFSATFPLQVESSNISQSPENTHPGRRIQATAPVKSLIVDDMETNRDLLEHMLIEYGMEVRLAESGKTALKIFEDYQPDVVFLDISMPEMDGFEVVKRMRQLEKDKATPTIIIAVTAAVLNHSREGYLKAGFDEFLGKPIDVNHLMSAIISTMPNLFRWRSNNPPTETDIETLHLDESSKKQIKELAENYATSGILRITDALEKSSDPSIRASARMIAQLAQNGNMNEIIHRLDQAN